MTAFTRLGTWFGASVVIGALASACGGSGETNASSSGTSTETTSSSSSTTTTSSSGTGGTGGTGTGGTGGTGTGGMGTGGTGGTNMAGPHGPQSSQLVNAGDVVKSPSYKMVFTLGQPTQNQTKTTSPSYRMQGGLVGANGTLP